LFAARPLEPHVFSTLPGCHLVRPLFLIRLHKTAGTSFMTGLASAFAPDKICPWAFHHEFHDRPRAALAGYQFFWPHMGLDQARTCRPDARIVTILREPRARIVSSYRYWRSQERVAPDYAGHHDLCRKVRNMSLADYLASDDPAILRAIDNAQMRFMAGGGFGADAATRTQLYGPPGRPEDLVTIALRRMATDFAVVGVAERLQASLARAAEVLGLSIRPVDHRVNVNLDETDSGQEITARMESDLERLTRFDSLVYDQAVATLQASGG
jgi:hypothetical protein